MKLTYFEYYVVEHENPDERIICNLSPLIHNFCKFDNGDFKRSFLYKDGESVFLFWIGENVFLIIQTKSNEIIKTINSEKVDYGDLYNRLEKDEHLGFASFLYIDNGFYGMASTVHGPKNPVFVWLVNELFRRARVGYYEFQSQPFATQATREETLTLPIIGKNIIELDPGNSLAAQFLGLIGAGNTTEVGGLEIIIKPNHGRNMKHVAQAVAQHVGSEGVKKYIVKAKASLEDALTDYYITGVGVLADPIDRRNEKTIVSQIQTKVRENTDLSARMLGMRKDPRYVARPIPILDELGSIDSWSRYFQLLELIDRKWPYLHALFLEKATMAQVLSGFAFTTLGFLATVITFLFGLSERPFFRSYVHHGHMGSFLTLYLLTMMTLMFTFVTSILIVRDRMFLDLCVTGALLSVIEISFISVIGYNVTKRSLRKSIAAT